MAVGIASAAITGFATAARVFLPEARGDGADPTPRRVTVPMEAIVLDGATLTPAAVARVAREGVPVELGPGARARNESARGAVETVLARGDELYGASTGVGPLRTHRVDEASRA